jgi:hypothetical protein
MAADWGLPTLGSLYTNVLDNLKDRDIDGATMVAPSASIPTGYIRYNRSTNVFEEWSGSAWVVLLVSLAGGGTGASSASSARTNLGLGTMALQNSNAVTITGGTISGLTSLGVSGNFTATGTGDFGNLLTVNGLIIDSTDGLPTDITANVYHGGGFSSPEIGRVYIGNGTNKKYFFSTRVASVTADVFEFRDTGRFVVRSNQPIIEVRDLNASANMGVGGFYNTGDNIHFYTINDAENLTDEYLRIIRESSTYLVDRAEFHTSLIPKEKFGLGAKTAITINASSGAQNNQVLAVGAQ